MGFTALQSDSAIRGTETFMKSNRYGRPVFEYRPVNALSANQPWDAAFAAPAIESLRQSHRTSRHCRHVGEQVLRDRPLASYFCPTMRRRRMANGPKGEP